MTNEIATSLQVITSDFCEINGAIKNFTTPSSPGSEADGTGLPSRGAGSICVPNLRCCSQRREKESHTRRCQCLTSADKC